MSSLLPPIHHSVPLHLYPLVVVRDPYEDTCSIQTTYAPWTEWLSMSPESIANLPFTAWAYTDKLYDISSRTASVDKLLEFLGAYNGHEANIIAVYTTPTTSHTLREFQINYPEYFL